MKSGDEGLELVETLKSHDYVLDWAFYFLFNIYQDRAQDL